MSTPPLKHSSSLDRPKEEKDRSRDRDKDKEKPKQDIGYYRVLGIQKEKGSSSSSSNFSKYDKLPSPSFNPMNLFSGEKKEDRNKRVKLNYYKQLLQADFKLAEKALSTHVGRYEALQVEFSEQKGQLTRWGLQSLIKSFRMQSWLRQSRGELLMDMTTHIMQTLQTKLTEVTTLLSFLNLKGSNTEVPSSSASESDIRKQVDAITDKFYLSPEALLEKDKNFLKKRQRLSAIDKLCHTASAKFRESLPQLNSKDFAERSRVILAILKRYSSMLDAKNLCIDSDIASKRSWHDFSLWYEDKCAKENMLFGEYLEFIDDEREREGRLFRRWCNLVRGSSVDMDSPDGDVSLTVDESVSPKMNSTDSKTDTALVVSSDCKDMGGQYISSANASSSRQSSAEGGERDKVGAVEANAAYMLFPKCIQIFIRYFSINIIASTYDVPQSMHGALLALTETVIHRSVHQSLFRYPSLEMKRKDRAWRAHALRCRFVDPLDYHIAPKHLGIKSSKCTSDLSSVEPSSLDKHISMIASGSENSTTVSSAKNKSASGSFSNKLHVLQEENESPGYGKDSEVVIPQKVSSNTMTTPPSSSSTISSSTISSDLSLSPPFPPPSGKPGNFSRTPPAATDSKKNYRSSSTSDISSSSSIRGESGHNRSRLSRSRSSSSNGLAAIGGKTLYCETVLQNIRIMKPLHQRMENLLASRLEKSSKTMESEKNGVDLATTTVTSTADTNTELAENDDICKVYTPLPLMIDLHPPAFKKLKAGVVVALNPKTNLPDDVHDPFSSAENVALYSIPARVMGLLSLAVSPRDAIVIILLSVQWLTRTAQELQSCAGKVGTEAIGADDMFPLLVNVLAHANIPCIHLIMHYLHTYTVMESFGEAAYYVTSMGAAVEFIDTTYVSESEEDLVTGDTLSDDEEEGYRETYAKEILELEDVKTKEKEFGEAAVNHLGEWLRDQQVMEDTMVVMMQEGWMG